MQNQQLVTQPWELIVKVHAKEGIACHMNQILQIGGVKQSRDVDTALEEVAHP